MITYMITAIVVIAIMALRQLSIYLMNKHGETDGKTKGSNTRNS